MANIYKKKALSFDDVLLVPQYSVVHPQEVNVSTVIGETSLKLPIFSAAMDTLTGYEMANALAKLGGCGVVHKNMTIKKQAEIAALLDNERKKNDNYHFAMAVGVGDYDRIYHLLGYDPTFIVVDSAHGDTKAMCDFVETLLTGKDKNGDALGYRLDPMKLIIGNISTGDAAIRLYRSGVRIVKVGQGSGCFVGKTRVLMANGYYKDIKDIVVGDKVINGLGRVDTVVGRQESGVKEVYKYRHLLGIGESYCTSDHAHMVADVTGIKKSSLEKATARKVVNKSLNKRYKWKDLGSMDTDNFYCTIPAQVDLDLPKTFNVDIVNSVTGQTVLNLVPTYNIGYLFGIFLGDGNASVIEGTRKGKTSWYRPKNTTGAVRFYLSNDYPEIAQKLQKILIDLGLSSLVKQKSNANMTTTYVWSLPLARFFNEFGKVENKKLPENLLVCNKEYLQGLYDGLIDSDGFENEHRDRLSNTSKSLVEMFGVLCSLLYGRWPSVTKRTPRTHVSKQRGLIAGRLDSYITSNHSKLASKILKNGQQLSQIREIKSYGYEQTYDIQLKDEPSFIANNAVVHNSICSTRIVAGIGVPQFQAIADISDAREESGMSDLYIIADGGLRYSGDIVKALAAGAHAVMLGGMLAGTDESLGGTEYRGMGSIPAMEAGSASRYNNDLKKLTPEGVEATVNSKGPVADVLAQIEGGIRAGMGYTGSGNLEELRESWFTEITNSGLKESHPHSLLSIKSAPNYK